MSYIVNNAGTELIAIIRGEPHKSGETVTFSMSRLPEAINAAREWNLVNAGSGKISNAKKWTDKARLVENVLDAEELNPGEFWLR